jgi:hypothetical protein
MTHFFSKQEFHHFHTAANKLSDYQLMKPQTGQKDDHTL